MNLDPRPSFEFFVIGCLIWRIYDVDPVLTPFTLPNLVESPDVYELLSVDQLNGRGADGAWVAGLLGSYAIDGRAYSDPLLI